MEVCIIPKAITQVTVDDIIRHGACVGDTYKAAKRAGGIAFDVSEVIKLLPSEAGRILKATQNDGYGYGSGDGSGDGSGSGSGGFK